MSFDWEEYIALAKDLERRASSSTNPTPDALLKSSISRAYYGALHLCRCHLRDKDGHNIAVDDGRVHFDVTDSFLESDDLERIKIGNDLRKLKSKRVKADYKDSVSGLASHAREAIIYSDRIISKLAIV